MSVGTAGGPTPVSVGTIITQVSSPCATSTAPCHVTVSQTATLRNLQCLRLQSPKQLLPATRIRIGGGFAKKCGKYCSCLKGKIEADTGRSNGLRTHTRRHNIQKWGAPGSGRAAWEARNSIEERGSGVDQR